MTKTIILTGLAILGTILVSSVSFADAAVDYFLKIPGVDGESTAAGHENEIDVLSWSWGETNDSSHKTSTSGTSGKATLGDVSVTIVQDKSTANLMQFCTDGKQISDKVILTARRTGEPQDYFIIKMKPVYITSYQTGGSSGDIVPTDTISLNFGEIEYEYMPLRPDGSVETAKASKKPGHRF